MKYKTLAIIFAISMIAAFGTQYAVNHSDKLKDLVED